MSCLSRRKLLLQQVAALILLLVVMFLTCIAWDCFLLKPDFRILKGVQLKQLNEWTGVILTSLHPESMLRAAWQLLSSNDGHQLLWQVSKRLCGKGLKMTKIIVGSWNLWQTEVVQNQLHRGTGQAPAVLKSAGLRQQVPDTKLETRRGLDWAIKLLAEPKMI